MLDSIWDWWFGDGPLRRWLRTMWGRADRRLARRHWVLLLATGSWTAAGFAPQGLSQSVRAEGPSSGNAMVFPALVLRMPQQASQPEPIDPPSPGRAEEAIQNYESTAEQRLQRLLEENDAVQSVDEDAARRGRLRDLLRRSDDESSERDQEPPPAPVRRSVPSDRSNDDQFADSFIENRLPQVEGQTLRLPPLRAVSIATGPIGNGRLPDDFVAQDALATVPLPEDAFSRGLTGAGTWLSWAAPNTFSHPLYFEDRMLERHGHERWGCLQPIAAGARFFTTVPMLPYLSTIQEPSSIVYSKGYLRAGSPVPRYLQRPPLERRAVVVEAAAISGAILALP